MLDRKEASEPTDFAEPGGLKSRADGSLLGGGGDVEEPNRGAFGRRREEHMSRRILILVIGAAAVIGCAMTGRSAVTAGDAPVAIQVTDQPSNDQPQAVPATGAPASSAAPAPSATPAAGTAPAASRAPAVPPVASGAGAGLASSPTAPVAPQPASSAPSVTRTSPVAPAASPAASPAATPPATAAPPPAVLELGVVHPWVGFSQSRLNSLGYGALDVDQRFGPATQAAVVRFEQVNATTVDGRLEANERLLLLSHNALANDAPTPAVPQPISGPPPPPAVPPAKLTPPPPPTTTAATAAAVDPLATPATARTNGNCQAIAAEFVRQGAELAVAEEFAYVIAPRESGCVPQEVNNPRTSASAASASTSGARCPCTGATSAASPTTA